MGGSLSHITHAFLCLSDFSLCFGARPPFEKVGDAKPSRDITKSGAVLLPFGTLVPNHPPFVASRKPAEDPLYTLKRRWAWKPLEFITACAHTSMVVCTQGHVKRQTAPKQEGR